MVSPLTWKRSDPNKKRRGAGFYYKRNTHKRGWWSKYKNQRDAKKRARHQKKNVNPRYVHTVDRNTRKKKVSTVRISPRKTRRRKGWF